MISIEFLEAARSHGFELGNVIDDGEYHRFDIRPGDKAGYYCLDDQGCGVFGNWKTSEQFLFRSGKFNKMTDSEREEAHARFKAEQKRKKQEKEQEYKRVAMDARKIWESSLPAKENHPYLAKKKIQPHGARVDDAGNLIIPIYKNNEIVNIQRINNLRKLFLLGGEKSGCYSTVEGDEDIIYIAEGFSTAASIVEATGYLCVVALDAGNMVKVARKIRSEYGVGKKIIICGDNDQWTFIDGVEKNVGLLAAEEAAKAIYSELRIPDFPVDDPEKRTDWNDYVNAFGKDIACEVLKDVSVKEVEPYRESVSLAVINEDFTFDENGRPKCTIENLKLLAKRKNITLRYNVIKKQEEILIPGETYSLDNGQNAAYAKMISICKDADMPTSQIGDYLTYLCDQNQYNPVMTWITSKEWDGESRIERFFNTISSSDKDVKELILTRWMISAVASAFSREGLSTRGVLVFQGEQYLGKTSWFKKLVPKELDVRKDGYILRLDDKDNMFQCLSHWLIELGELEATFKKSDIAQLKAFIPMDRDIMRRPYARKDSCYARRTVFFASVNQKEFLFDETGNTRFWSIPTLAIDYNHNLDMQQVWAEFYALYLDGEPYIMSADEMKMINTNNEEFMGADYHEELVARRLDWDQLVLDGNLGGSWRTATELCAILNVQNPKQQDLNRISKAVKKYNGNKTKRGVGGVRLLLVPNERNSAYGDHND